jgi:acyl carrier protein
VDRSEALQVLRETAAEILAVDPNAVVEDARFQEDLEADSLDMIELVMALEDKICYPCSTRGSEEHNHREAGH